jgi:ribosomal protein S1
MTKDNQTDPDVKFDLSQIEKTFTHYKLNEIVDGVVIQKQENGVLVNIGGKLDAFIPESDFKDYSLIKFGDRFKVAITSMKNEEGMLEVSKSKADVFVADNLQASSLKIGKTFSFVVLSSQDDTLRSKIGEYDVFVPRQHLKNQRDLRSYVNKRLEAIVIDLNEESKTITASVTMLEERIKQNLSLAFWNSVFVNKLVSGKIVKDLGFGVLVNVNGVTCFCHISEVAYERIEKITDILHMGKEYTFKVIEVDRENQKVALSYKALQKSQKQKLFDEIKIKQTYAGTVIKLLDFGAIIELENGLSGLLHISDASRVFGTIIKDILKKDEKIDVVVKNFDSEKEKIYFELEDKR